MSGSGSGSAGDVNNDQLFAGFTLGSTQNLDGSVKDFDPLVNTSVKKLNELSPMLVHSLNSALGERDRETFNLIQNNLVAEITKNGFKNVNEDGSCDFTFKHNSENINITLPQVTVQAINKFIADSFVESSFERVSNVAKREAAEQEAKVQHEAQMAELRSGLNESRAQAVERAAQQAQEQAAREQAEQAEQAIRDLNIKKLNATRSRHAKHEKDASTDVDSDFDEAQAIYQQIGELTVVYNLQNAYQPSEAELDAAVEESKADPEAPSENANPEYNVLKTLISLTELYESIKEADVGEQAETLKEQIQQSMQAFNDAFVNYDGVTPLAEFKGTQAIQLTKKIVGHTSAVETAKTQFANQRERDALLNQVKNILPAGLEITGLPAGAGVAASSGSELPNISALAAWYNKVTTASSDAVKAVSTKNADDFKLAIQRTIQSFVDQIDRWDLESDFGTLKEDANARLALYIGELNESYQAAYVAGLDSTQAPDLSENSVHDNVTTAAQMVSTLTETSDGNTAEEIQSAITSLKIIVASDNQDETHQAIHDQLKVISQDAIDIQRAKGLGLDKEPAKKALQAYASALKETREDFDRLAVHNRRPENVRPADYQPPEVKADRLISVQGASRAQTADYARKLINQARNASAATQIQALQRGRAVRQAQAEATRLSRVVNAFKTQLDNAQSEGDQSKLTKLTLMTRSIIANSDFKALPNEKQQEIVAHSDLKRAVATYEAYTEGRDLDDDATILQAAITSVLTERFGGTFKDNEALAGIIAEQVSSNNGRFVSRGEQIGLGNLASLNNEILLQSVLDASEPLLKMLDEPFRQEKLASILREPAGESAGRAGVTPRSERAKAIIKNLADFGDIDQVKTHLNFLKSPQAGQSRENELKQLKNRLDKLRVPTDASEAPTQEGQPAQAAEAASAGVDMAALEARLKRTEAIARELAEIAEREQAAREDAEAAAREAAAQAEAEEQTLEPVADHSGQHTQQAGAKAEGEVKAGASAGAGADRPAPQASEFKGLLQKEYKSPMLRRANPEEQAINAIVDYIGANKGEAYFSKNNTREYVKAFVSQLSKPEANNKEHFSFIISSFLDKHRNTKISDLIGKINNCDKPIQFKGLANHFLTGLEDQSAQSRAQQPDTAAVSASGHAEGHTGDAAGEDNAFDNEDAEEKERPGAGAGLTNLTQTVIRAVKEDGGSETLEEKFIHQILEKLIVPQLEGLDDKQKSLIKKAAKEYLSTLEITNLSGRPERDQKIQHIADKLMPKVLGALRGGTINNLKKAAAHYAQRGSMDESAKVKGIIKYFKDPEKDLPALTEDGNIKLVNLDGQYPAGISKDQLQDFGEEFDLLSFAQKLQKIDALAKVINAQLETPLEGEALNQMRDGLLKLLIEKKLEGDNTLVVEMSQLKGFKARFNFILDHASVESLTEIKALGQDPIMTLPDCATESDFKLNLVQTNSLWSEQGNYFTEKNGKWVHEETGKGNIEINQDGTSVSINRLADDEIGKKLVQTLGNQKSVRIDVQNITQFRRTATQLFKYNFKLSQPQLQKMIDSPAKSIAWQRDKLVSILKTQRDEINSSEEPDDKKEAQLAKFDQRVERFLGKAGQLKHDDKPSMFDAIGVNKEHLVGLRATIAQEVESKAEPVADAATGGGSGADGAAIAVPERRSGAGPLVNPTFATSFANADSASDHVERATQPGGHSGGPS